MMMTRANTSVIAASALAAFAIFFAASAFTPASGKTTDPITILTERLEFRMERLETVLTAMQTAMETMLTEMQKAWETMNHTMLRLSDDIGKMANRILLMAGQIGKMADRIVETMVIMTDTLLEMQETMAAMLLALQNGNNSAVVGVSGAATLILSPSEGQTLTDTTQFELAGDHDDFILYASSDAGMANATNILVQDNLLTAAVARIKGYVSSDKVYVAAKVVDGGAVGELSNTVMLFVP